MSESYHVPVLFDPSLDGLITDTSGVYVDVTFGGGGHSKGILDRISKEGQLYAFDQDPDAVSQAPQDERFTLIESNFRYFSRFLRVHKVSEVDGILADLGVSSYQFDQPERGFTHRQNANLDMRMSQQGVKTAATILNEYTEKALWDIFGHYGEIRNARTLAAKIAAERQVRSIHTVDDLRAILDQVVIGDRHRYLSQVFQALRIEVNEELESLKEMLAQSLQMLKPGGRLVVLSYHSLEDRLVKHFFKSGTFTGELIKDDFGKITRPFRIITKKPVTADADEIRQNPRSSSAKLRIAEKK